MTTEAPAPAPPAEEFAVRHRYRILLALTVAGGFVRFATLNRPPLWGDEALTYSRVIGTWDQMFEILQYDGFMPLHYVLYWLLAQVVTLTPAMMRLIPAICGTAMIPAMYFLTRQIGGVKPALLAAAFAACSAYLMAYSHDAKMYMPMWLFTALNLGFFFAWIGKGGVWRWLGWAVTGAVALGFGIQAALMLIPQILIFCTSQNRIWPRLPLLIVGLSLIGAFPAYYFEYVNKLPERTGTYLPSQTTQAPGAWQDNVIGWVEDHNRGFTGPQLVREAASAYLLGVEWPGLSHPDDAIESQALIDAVYYAFWGLMWLCGIGLLCIRKKRNDSERHPFAWWQILLWMLWLLTIPVYWFYCRSIKGFSAPLDAQTPFYLMGSAIVITFIHLLGLKQVNRLLLVMLGVLFAGFVVYISTRIQYEIHWSNVEKELGFGANAQNRPDRDWKSIWMPRYVAIVWPAVGAAVAILLMRLPTRPLRWVVISGLLGFNLYFAFGRIFGGTEPPHDRIFADVKTARDDANVRIVITTPDSLQTWTPKWLNASWYGLFGSASKYYACMALDLHPTPQEFRQGSVTMHYREHLGQPVDPKPVISQVHGVKRVIIWERSSADYGPPKDVKDDVITRSLGKDWQLVAEPQVFQLRRWLNWGDMGWMRRREYVRAGS